MRTLERPVAAPRTLVRGVVDVVGVLVVFAVAGAGAGWLWQHLWTPTPGGVVDGVWYPLDLTALKNDFGATAIYLFVGFPTALVLGVLAAYVARRSELVTLVAVTVGAVLAALIAYRVGVHLGPPDPQPLAATSADLTLLPGELTMPGRSPFVVWPLGALLGLGLTYLLTLGVAESRRREVDDPHWLSSHRSG